MPSVQPLSPVTSSLSCFSSPASSLSQPHTSLSRCNLELSRSDPRQTWCPIVFQPSRGRWKRDLISLPSPHNLTPGGAATHLPLRCHPPLGLLKHTIALYMSQSQQAHFKGLRAGRSSILLSFFFSLKEVKFQRVKNGNLTARLHHTT